jgi:hypothetical protein
MDTQRSAVCAVVASFLALAGCATSPEDELKRQEMEADIDDILSQYVDPAEYGEPSNCLGEKQVRHYRGLGTRHLLIEGRQGQLWVNMLRGRCSGLDKYSVFIMRPNVAGRLCDMDHFSVVDRIGSPAIAAPNCVLGEFKPVTEAQVKEIEDRLEMR